MSIAGPIPPGRFLPFMTADAVRALAARGDAVVVLPLGATEQHGPHLPLFTDTCIAVEVLGRALERLPDEAPVYALPPLWCGKSNEHVGFAGTLSLSAETLLRVLMEIGTELYRSGLRRLVLLNGHGGQPQIVEIVARDLRARFPDFCVFPLFVWSVPNATADLLTARECRDGLHAGRAETSLMLALEPSAVRLDAAVAEYPPEDCGALSAEGRLRYAWLTQDLSGSGVIGDPIGASTAEGEAILASLVEAWTGLLEEIVAFRMPAAGSAGRNGRLDQQGVAR
jgi:creatinine amidohydrolase